jgi:hypothetical protein
VSGYGSPKSPQQNLLKRVFARGRNDE